MADRVASVVVATYNRAEKLDRLLAALAAQEGVDRFEVVVVDDASPDDTQAVLQRWATVESPFDLVAFRQAANQGPATARNRGWQAATGSVVCFTDDDCAPVAVWLAEMIAALAHADIVQGRTAPAPDQLHRMGPFSRTLVIPREEGLYETCNMGYRRAVLEATGGFDESFRFPYGEDTDLAWRAKDAGAASTFAADAVVYHDVLPSDFVAVLRDMPRRDGLVHAFKKHPRLRQVLGKGVFFRPTHPPALAGLVAAGALVVAPGSAVVWLASAGVGGWYAYMCRRLRPKPRRRVGWLGVVPLAWVADLYEVAVMARASVRHRTLLL